MSLTWHSVILLALSAMEENAVERKGLEIHQMDWEKYWSELRKGRSHF